MSYEAVDRCLEKIAKQVQSGEINEVVIGGVTFVRRDSYNKERTCKKLPSGSEYICIVRHRSGLEGEFGYWKCSECKCDNFEGAEYCMKCGARAE